MLPRMRALCLLAALLPACIDTDAAVFVEATVQAAALSVQGSSLVTGLGGGATLSLHLGPRASGPSTATIVGVSLVSASGTDTLASTLGFTSDPPLPTTVGVDDTIPVTLTFDPADNELPAMARDAICAAEVRVRVVIDDSLRGSSVTTDSAPFQVTNCP